MPLFYTLLLGIAFYSSLFLIAYTVVKILEATARLLSYLVVESMRMAAVALNALLTGLYQVAEAVMLTIYQTGQALAHLFVNISDYFFKKADTASVLINNDIPEPSAPAQEIDFNTIYVPSAGKPLYMTATPLRFFSEAPTTTAAIMTSDQIDFYESMMQRQF